MATDGFADDAAAGCVAADDAAGCAIPLRAAAARMIGSALALGVLDGEAPSGPEERAALDAAVRADVRFATSVAVRGDGNARVRCRLRASGTAISVLESPVSPSLRPSELSAPRARFVPAERRSSLRGPVSLSSPSLSSS
jgi:hypothetical protein